MPKDIGNSRTILHFDSPSINHLAIHIDNWSYNKHTLNCEGILAVACSIRIFIVGQDDTLYRIARTKFTGMFDDPENHPILRLAGQRVRMAEAIVEVRDRVPYSIVRLIYEILRFDEYGKLDRDTFVRQNFALAELALDAPTINNTVIVDASNRFIAQGGHWQPSPKLERKIRQTALGEEKYQRL